jgi:DNA transformation protein
MKQDSFKDFVVDQLAGLGELTCKRMFGSFGLYHGPAFFGIIHKGQIFFKTDENSRGAYEALGMGVFQPNEKLRSKRYFEVPAHVLENPSELVLWARRAIAASPSP